MVHTYNTLETLILALSKQGLDLTQLLLNYELDLTYFSHFSRIQYVFVPFYLLNIASTHILVAEPPKYVNLFFINSLVFTHSSA